MGTGSIFDVLRLNFLTFSRKRSAKWVFKEVFNMVFPQEHGTE